jgi:hypothetical protein
VISTETLDTEAEVTNNRLDVIAIAFISVPESSRLETLTKTELSLALVVE